MPRSALTSKRPVDRKEGRDDEDREDVALPGGNASAEQRAANSQSVDAGSAREREDHEARATPSMGARAAVEAYETPMK